MGEPADLSDKATLFQAYVDALLVANSLIVGALALSPTAVGPDSP